MRLACALRRACASARASCASAGLLRGSTHGRAPRRAGGSGRRAPRSRGNSSKLAHAGASRTVWPGSAAAAAAANACSRPSQRWSGTPVARARPRSDRPRDQSGTPRRSARRPAPRGRAKSSPLSEPPRIAWTPPSNERSAADGRRHVRRLRVVDVGDAADLGHPLEPVRDARRSERSRVSTAAGSRPIASAAAAAKRAFARVVRADDPVPGGCERKLRGGDVDLASLAGEVEAGDHRVRAVDDREVPGSLAGEHAQLRARGTRRRCGGGRGGPAWRSGAARTRARSRPSPRAGSSTPRRRRSRPSSSSPTSDASGVPTLPATATGSPAARQTWPSSSATVVLPFVPVTATKRLGSSRQASSSSPMTGTPRVSARRTAGAWRGTPGLLTTHCARSTSSSRSPSRFTSTPASRNLSAPSGAPGVGPDHLLPALGEQPRGGLPRTGEADDQIRPFGAGAVARGVRPHA